MFLYNLLVEPRFEVQIKVIDKIMTTISNSVNKTQLWTLNIVFVDDDSIQKLNKDYRNKDEVTDVLSFHYYDNFSWLDKEEIAGEIIMNENKITLQAKEYKLGEEKEFYKLLIHSVLHILWYDHEQEQQYQIMQAIEDQIWQEVFEK